MRIIVEQCYSNGWRGKENTKNLNINELRELALSDFNKIKKSLSVDDKIIVCDNPSVRDVEWKKQSETDPAHEQVRVRFRVKKNGRTKLTENDIYKKINEIHVSYFSKH